MLSGVSNSEPLWQRLALSLQGRARRARRANTRRLFLVEYCNYVYMPYLHTHVCQNHCAGVSKSQPQAVQSCSSHYSAPAAGHLRLCCSPYLASTLLVDSVHWLRHDHACSGSESTMTITQKKVERKTSLSESLCQTVAASVTQLSRLGGIGFWTRFLEAPP